MGNYKAYFVLSALLGFIALTIIANALISGYHGGLFLIGLVQIPLGLLQLTSGLRLLADAHTYPAWVKKDLRVYWLLTGGYFAGLLLVRYAFAYVWPVWVVWLYIVPWGIAIYQFGIVWRMAALRKRQLEKRELLQLFNH